MHYRMFFLFVLLAFVAPTVSLAAPLESHLDCQAKALRAGELAFQQRIRPYMATVADKYHGDSEELARKKRERGKIFRQWLKMRCQCKPPGQSLLEMTMCQALQS